MKALKNRIIVEPIPAPAMHAGLHLVEKHHPPSTAKVVAIGPKIAAEWVDLKPDATVAIRPMGGMDLDFRGRKLKLMEPEHVLAILE